MLSAVAAFVPETQLEVDGKSCLSVGGREGTCSAIRDSGDRIVFGINLLSKSSEVSWASRCFFNWNGKRVNEGSFVTSKQKAYVTLSDIPIRQEGAKSLVCAVGFFILDTDRGKDAVMPASAGSIAIVHIIVGDPNYVSLPDTQIRFKGDTVYVKASRFAKNMRIHSKTESATLSKLNEVSFDKPPIGTPITISIQSDITRKNSVTVRTR